jgi:hypothetical protein
MRRNWGLLTGGPPAGPAAEVNTAFTPIFSGLKDFQPAGPWNPEVQKSLDRAVNAAGKRFTFLNLTVDLSGGMGWDDPGLSRLWRYHLHYFDFAQDLLVWAAAGHREPAYRAFRDLADSWVDSNRKVRGDGWHPYTISLRLVNWLEAAALFSEQLGQDEVFRLRLLDSLRAQAAILHRDLEMDVRGNHLLANLRALVWFSLAFNGREAEAWRGEALNLLREEISEQVLPDGGHFERSPGYHLTVLQHCLETALVLKRNGKVPPPWLESAVRRMLEFLVAIQSPDSNVPLIKDTVWGGSPSPNELLATGVLYFQDRSYKRSFDFGLYPLLLFGNAGWKEFRGVEENRRTRESVALETSGFYIWRDDDNRDYLILDAGKPCPSYLPAHAHADLLSYELIVQGRRVVVDSGVYEYAAGAWRDYFRSTSAHNTVVVEDRDQSEVWDSFRVARRANPGNVIWIVNEASGLAQAHHDGYSGLPARVIHRRTVAWRRDRFWIVVDELRGLGSARAYSSVHFNPRISLASCGDEGWRVDGGELPLWIAAFGESERTVIGGRMGPRRQGWYSEQFGLLEPNSVLVLSTAKPLPVCLGYVISKRSAAVLEWIASPGMNRIMIRHNRDEFGLAIPAEAPPTFE